MKRLFQAIAGLLILTGASNSRAQDSGNFILAARRTGVAELIDPATLETVARIHFDFHVERLFVGSDGSELYVDGYGAGGCCEHYTLDLSTLKLNEAGSNEENGFGNSLRSPDGRWRVELKSFRGPALKMFDLETGAVQELTPAALPLSEEECGGNWAAGGTWSGGHFYFYVACPNHPGFLWTVSPGATELGAGVPVAPFGEAPDCQERLPLDKMLVAAGETLLLHEPFGSKADRTPGCQTRLPGGAWMLDPATGRLTRQIAAGFHFNVLIPDSSGSTLYGVDPGNGNWGGPVKLVALNVRDNEVMKSRVLDPGVLQISIGQLRQVPKGDVQISSPSQ